MTLDMTFFEEHLVGDSVGEPFIVSRDAPQTVKEEAITVNEEYREYYEDDLILVEQ